MIPRIDFAIAEVMLSLAVGSVLVYCSNGSQMVTGSVTLSAQNTIPNESVRKNILTMERRR